MNPFTVMQERLPNLKLDLDEWTLRMMHWHFSETTGSPFWLRRAAELDFDPLRHVRSYSDLAKFGFFDVEVLRSTRASELLPRGLSGRRWRVFESGGTTGNPCRIPNVTKLDNEVTMYEVVLQARGLPPGDVVGMVPAGPHQYGHLVNRVADLWHTSSYLIDLDPRWVKRELREGRTPSRYVDHVIGQTISLLELVRPTYLFTTPRLLMALLEKAGTSLAEYGVAAVCTGGTSCSPEERRFVVEEYLGDSIHWIDTYGNTLVGHCLMAGSMTEASFRPSYYLPPPLGTTTLLGSDDLADVVPTGERGRVCNTALLEDLFIPNFRERDSARSAPPHEWFPWPGVTEVGPLRESGSEADAVEGVY